MIKKANTENGFTLIEVIVAIAIMVMIIFAFSMLFSESYTNIYASGNKSEAQYMLQDAAENELSAVSKDLTELGVIRESFNVSGFEISFEGIDNVILDGDRVTLENTFSDGKGNQRVVIITVFIPAGSN